MSDFLKRQTEAALKRIEDAKHQRQKDWRRIQTELPSVADILKTFGKPKHMRVEFDDGHVIESGEKPKHQIWNGKLRACTKPAPYTWQQKAKDKRR